MFSQIQKKPLLQFLCQDSMSISTTSSLPWSLASVRLSSFIASMSARSIGGKGFLQYWKVLYCQNSSLIFRGEEKKKVYQWLRKNFKKLFSGNKFVCACVFLKETRVRFYSLCIFNIFNSISKYFMDSVKSIY